MPNYLNSPLGVFTYYNDSSLYNYFVNKYVNYTFLIQNGAVTADGETFKNNFPINSLYLSIQKRAGNVAVEFINMFNSFFPNTTYRENEPNQTYEFYNNTNKYIKTESNVRLTPINDGGSDIYGYTGSNNYGFLYGGIDSYSSEPDLRDASFSIIIFDDEYNNYVILGFGALYSPSYKEMWVKMGRLANNSYRTAFINYFKNATPDPHPPIEDTDPYAQGGNTGSGGGSGNFDHTSDPVDIPSLPTLSAADTGFITLFNPSAAQLRDLANYMWSNPLFDLDAWKKIFADPMDAILGLSIVPVNVPSGGATAVTVGNISTGVSMTKATAQYVEVDCGSLNVQEFWGAYLDYAPYTKCEIHLPYCGIHPLDIDDVMGKTVTVKYHVDILSGACCAYVKCGDSVLYEFVGQCAASIPITGDNWTNVINGVMQIAASVGTMVATGGLAAPVTGANAAKSIGQAVAIDANIASTIMSMKPSIEKSGSLGGVGGMLAIQKPYLILTRPNQALPANQNKYTGYPAFITLALADLEGYTEIEQIHLENVPATSAELDEIITLLKGGVIL